jgi:GT2 family glycosyltransferase
MESGKTAQLRRPQAAHIAQAEQYDFATPAKDFDIGMSRIAKSISLKRIAVVMIHYGEPGRTVQAVLRHHGLGIFTDIVVVANDLSERPDGLESVPCTWLIPNRNLGYGAACQFAAERIPADVYGFFNAHISISSDAVRRCLDAFNEEDVGIVAPCSYYPHPKGAREAWKYTYCIRTYTSILGLPASIPSKERHHGSWARGPEFVDNDWASGGDVFCRHEVITDVGWDGSYFLTVEDVDLCMRAKRSGWRVVAVQSATAFHTGESTRTSAVSTYYGMRNSVWFSRRYRRRWAQIMLSGYLILCLLRISFADAAKKRRPPNARPALRGLWDGWRLWPDSAAPLPGEPLWPKENPAEERLTGCEHGAGSDQRIEE